MQYIDKRDMTEYYQQVKEYDQQELDWKKEYYSNRNRNRYNPTIRCECGIFIKQNNIALHRKRNVHLKRLNIVH